MQPAVLSARVWGKTMRGQTVKVLPVRPIGRRNCTCMGGLTRNSLLQPSSFVGRFNCCRFRQHSLLEIRDQDFCALLNMYVFANGASFSTKEGSVFLCRHYICCTVVSARVYPRCHGVQATMYSVQPLSLHYTM
jgi:hypothetical protein